MTAPIIPHYSHDPYPKGQLWARLAESSDPCGEHFRHVTERPAYFPRLAMAYYGACDRAQSRALEEGHPMATAVFRPKGTKHSRAHGARVQVLALLDEARLRRAGIDTGGPGGSLFHIRLPGGRAMAAFEDELEFDTPRIGL